MVRILTFVLFVFTPIAYSQNYELGRVTAEELSEKVCPIDTSAAAAYLFKNELITYDGNGEFVKETRIKLKIYKKEGYRYANVAEAFFKASRAIEFADVATYNLVNGQVVKTKLGKESEFKEEVSKEVAVKKITLPEVKEGSIIEYRIIDYTNSIYRLVNFYFQEEIPVKSVMLTVEHSERLFYNKTLSGYLSPATKTVTLTDTYFKKYLKNRTIYELTDVPALKDEGFVNNINNYRSRIRYELASLQNGMGYTENLATDWETVTKKFYESEGFGGELKKTGYFEKELDLFLADKNTRDDRINAVLAFVKEKVKWNGDYGVVCDKGVKDAFKNRAGNVADVNLMLTAMLRYAGLDANPILITTRSQLINLNPSLTSNNYVICGIEVENDVILLDATSEYSLPNVLPIRDLNWFGRIVRKNGSSAEFDIMPKKNSQDIVNIIGSITADGEVTGKIRNKYLDYNAFVYRDTFNKIEKSSYLESLEKRYEGVEVSDFVIQNRDDLTQPVIEEYGFATNKSVEVIGDKLYFSPMLFFARTTNPFKQEKREYPVDFVYPNQDKYIISLTIPDNYSVEFLPESKSVSLPNNMANFKYVVSMNEKKMQLQCTFDINQTIVGSEYYDTLKRFFKEMVDKQTEKIVLKKM